MPQAGLGRSLVEHPCGEGLCAEQGLPGQCSQGTCEEPAVPLPVAQRSLVPGGDFLWQASRGDRGQRGGTAVSFYLALFKNGKRYENSHFFPSTYGSLKVFSQHLSAPYPEHRFHTLSKQPVSVTRRTHIKYYQGTLWWHHYKSPCLGGPPGV